MARRRHFNWGESAYYLIVAIYALAFILQHQVHLQDYAQWVYSGVILHGKWLGISLADYSCRLYPVPNSSTTVITAVRLGEKLRELSREHQIITISHLSAVASQADHHLAVSKAMKGARNVISVKEINGSELKQELARMAGKPQ
jgi:uncharacterized membrane-anchored protein